MINDLSPISIKDSLREFDEDELDEDELDEIDLERISNSTEKIKPNSSLKNVFGEPIKKSRQVKFGPRDLSMPDFKTMVSTGKSGRAQDSLNDPYDKNFINKAFKESLTKVLLDDTVKDESVNFGYKPSLDLSTRRMLEKMSSALGGKRILKEDLEKSLDLEYEIGDILLENDDE